MIIKNSNISQSKNQVTSKENLCKLNDEKISDNWFSLKNDLEGEYEFLNTYHDLRLHLLS